MMVLGESPQIGQVKLSAKLMLGSQVKEDDHEDIVIDKEDSDEGDSNEEPESKGL